MKWFEICDPLMRQALEYYASTGRRVPRPPQEEDCPGYLQWERYLGIDLSLYAFLREFEVEAAGRRESTFNAAAAASAFAGARLSQLIDLNIHIRSPERVGTRLSSMDITMMPFNALGVFIGDARALPLARLLIAAARRGWFQLDERYPIYIFMLLLLARFLEEPLPVALIASLRNTLWGNLLDCWDHPQAQSIAAMCAAACDVHTTRCNVRKDLDFSSGSWCYIPIELMLLMRLRAMRGLGQPQFDHPLWLPAFCCEPIAMKLPGDIVDAVEQRMAGDGFDEAWITDHVLEGEQ
ncbi:MAG: hypothetical protein ACJ8HI_17660 [Massilia sp.]